MARLPLVERLWRRIERLPNGCWQWTGAIKANGYAQVTIEVGKTGYVHRLMYELLVEPIPPGLQIDHLCFNRACCNPAHLEVVTALVNIRRAPTHYASRTRCLNGHEFDHFVIDSAGRKHRVCKTCEREANRRNYLRRKAARESSAA